MYPPPPSSKLWLAFVNISTGRRTNSWTSTSVILDSTSPTFQTRPQWQKFRKGEKEVRCYILKILLNFSYLSFPRGLSRVVHPPVLDCSGTVLHTSKQFLESDCEHLLLSFCEIIPGKPCDQHASCTIKGK